MWVKIVELKVGTEFYVVNGNWSGVRVTKEGEPAVYVVETEETKKLSEYSEYAELDVQLAGRFASELFDGMLCDNYSNEAITKEQALELILLYTHYANKGKLLTTIEGYITANYHGADKNDFIWNNITKPFYFS